MNHAAMAGLARAKDNEVTRVLPPSRPPSRKRLSRIAAALNDEIPDDPVARKEMRDRLVAALKERMSDPGNAAVPHEVFIRWRPW